MVAGLTEASQTEELLLRFHGPPALPVLVYLPGLHGDWTLIGRFRRALRERVRFVEVTYPRTLDWSLDDYAAALEKVLRENGIESGWVIAESFGSQVVWPLLGRGRFHVLGVVLAGGFVRHPATWALRLAEKLAGSLPLGLITKVLFGYARLIRARHSHSAELLAEINAFIDRRTELDRQAAKHRLHLLAQADPCAIVRSASVPIYALTGLLDPIVPWYWVRRWMKRNCPALREFHIVRTADHNVLSTGATEAAGLVIQWMETSNSKLPTSSPVKNTVEDRSGNSQPSKFKSQ
jgi:pimeloyl-ACP methyl ester carboxylesterase